MRNRWQKVLPFHLASTSFSLLFFPYTFFPSISKTNSSIFPHAEFSSICKYISKFGLMRNRWQKVLPFHLAPTSFSLVFFPYTFCSSISKKNSSIFPHAKFSSICKYISKFGLMRNRWQKVLPFHLASTSFSLVFFPYAKFSFFVCLRKAKIFLFFFSFFLLLRKAKGTTTRENEVDAR